MFRNTYLVCIAAMIVGFAATGNAASASTYYVSPAGSDKSPGTKAKPFKTIQKAASLMKPGDICYIRAGTYREKVRPARSGEPGKSIRFEAYPGETATISGADPVKGWKKYKGSICKTKIGWKTEQVFVDGQMMVEARWPNTGPDLLRQTYAKADETSHATRIVDLRLGQDHTMPDGYWDGALMWISGLAKSCSARIKRHEGCNLYFEMHDMSAIARQTNAENGLPVELYDPKVGTLYYLTRGPLSSLDAELEWWLDPKSLDLYLWPPQDADPIEHLVEAKRRNLAIDLTDLSHIALRGLSVFGATVTMAGSKHCKVDDCHFKYLSHVAEFRHMKPWGGPAWNAGIFDTGVIMGGEDNELTNSTIAYSAGNGVALLPSSSRNRIINCLIHDVNYAGLDCSAVYGYGTGHLIQHNTMFNTGDSVIIHRNMVAGRIEYNNLFNAGMINRDVGMTYTHGDSKGAVIAYNWMHDNPTGGGLYLDSGAANFWIHHNVQWNVSSGGINFGCPGPNYWFNNTLLTDKPNGAAVKSKVVNPDTDLPKLVANNIFLGRIQMYIIPPEGFPASYSPEEMIKPVIANNIQPPADLRYKKQAVRAQDEVHDKDIRNYFRDTENYDFRLVPGSPCVDAGREVPEITGRHSGKAPDIGAYEGDEMWIPGCKLTERGIKANGGPLVLPKVRFIYY